MSRKVLKFPRRPIPKPTIAHKIKKGAKPKHKKSKDYDPYFDMENA